MRWSRACALLGARAVRRSLRQGGLAARQFRIGTRPVDLRLTTLEPVGTEIELEGGYVVARAPRGLTGKKDQPLEGLGRRTHTARIAAMLARGGR